MQREIKRRAENYGIAAVIIAVILGAFCYSFGVYPQIAQLSSLSTAYLKTFTSYTDLKSFLLTHSKTLGYPYYYYPDVYRAFGNLGSLPMKEGISQYGTFASDTAPSYSTTNIQVSGVDEADIVKTDGQYIYLASGHSIYILRAYPPEQAGLLVNMTLSDIDPIGIYVNGDRLAVVGSKYAPLKQSYYEIQYFPYYYYSYQTSTCVKVYDISDRTQPVHLKDFAVDGLHLSSRMIGNYVYFVASEPAYVMYDTVNLPKVYTDYGQKEIEASEIHYANVTDNSFKYTTFAALNVQNTTELPAYATVMLGEATTMYVSLNNMYVTFPDRQGDTSICRIQIAGSSIACVANGTVPGHVHDQFSMDEYEGYFRIVTSNWMSGIAQNNLYVLDMNLSIVGQLENLGLGENLHSTRFMGDRCYLVTFKKVDPLFVIDLSEPANPKVLGELKIPGYSDYLHPYDENHIIGVGKETVEAEQGDFAWYQGIKVSLFDVSDVTHPEQMASYVIGDRGTDSPILRDHKAFLFDHSKNLLVIPVTVAKIDPTQYPGQIPQNAYGTPVWQGAYVFDITLAGGLVLKGNVTHREGPYTWDDRYDIQRALYIENMLYTISNAEVKINTLDNLALIGEVRLS